MSASTFTVTIQASASTLDALNGSGYWLFAYAAVQCSDHEAQPLVWMTTQRYSETTTVTGAAQFDAYTVPSPTVSGPVVPGFSAPIAAGQTLTVSSTAGSGTVTQGGAAGALTILNGTTTPLGCGISQVVAGAAAPVCLMPLHGENGQVIVPVPSILLLFSTQEAAAGTVAATAGGPGVLLDVGTAPQAAVSFDIDQGWSWGGATWGQAVEFGTPLAPLLVAPSASLATLAMLTVEAVLF